MSNETPDGTTRLVTSVILDCVPKSSDRRQCNDHHS